jgi:hypothetical protein
VIVGPDVAENICFLVARFDIGLKGSTNVTFKGPRRHLTFKWVSDSLTFNFVPSGATTGSVQVAIPSGTLTSNANFQVLP